MARLFIVGNLVRDPELKQVSTGAILKVTIAENYKPRQDAAEQVTYVDVTIWGDLAEHFAASCHKGQRVFAEGRLKQDNWEDDNGNKRSKLTLNADNAGIDLRFDVASATKPRESSPTQGPEDPF